MSTVIIPDALKIVGLIEWSIITAGETTDIGCSSMEAEFKALCAAEPEAIWLKMILADFNYRFREPNIIYEDSESCNAYMKNPT